jgi:hypothetical protein
MRPHHQTRTQQNITAPPFSSSPEGATETASFDAWMWQYIQTELAERHAEESEISSLPADNGTSPPGDASFDGEASSENAVEDGIELVWEFLKDRKYYQAQQHCRETLEIIEHDLAKDFAYDLTTLTLFDDINKERREHYLDTLEVYRKTLFSLVIALLLEMDDVKDIEPHYARYQELREEIQQAVSKVAYLLGSDYDDDLFFTIADLDEFDDLVRTHCRFLLKSEFFKTFKIVIQTLGDLDRKDFHLVTEPYKHLREQCHQCLELTAQMQDERFFGREDVFIEKYAHDVNVYLQILWYLGMKSDLNKTDKFLHPNTYSGGLDVQVQVFAAVALLQDVLPHLQKARAAGLGEHASADILEVYAEHWFVVLTHEEQQIRNDIETLDDNAERLRQIEEMKAAINHYTVLHTKIRRRVEFAHKFLKKTRMAFRLQDHNIIEVPNPEGRKMKDPTLILDFLEALEAPLFTSFLQELRLQYRSRHGVKMQRLRWAWFAERKLPEGYFEKPHYNYLDYIDSRWKDKIQAHYHTLNYLSRRDDD